MISTNHKDYKNQKKKKKFKISLQGGKMISKNSTIFGFSLVRHLLPLSKDLEDKRPLCDTSDVLIGPVTDPSLNGSNRNRTFYSLLLVQTGIEPLLFIVSSKESNFLPLIVSSKESNLLLLTISSNRNRTFYSLLLVQRNRTFYPLLLVQTNRTFYSLLLVQTGIEPIALYCY